MTCHITSNASGPCGTCRDNSGRPLHVVGEGSSTGLYCPDHCPVHKPASVDWKEPAPVTVTGEQEGLF